MKKALLITGPGFDDTEGLYSYHRLIEEGFTVDVATSNDQDVTGKHGGNILKVTVKAKEISVSNYEIIIIPGGLEGPDRVRQNQTLLEVVKQAYKKNKIIGAICHGPWVLISAGITKGKKATCYVGMKDDLINSGAKYTGSEIEIDGTIVTATHPRVVGSWMKKVIEAWKTKTKIANSRLGNSYKTQEHPN